MRICIRTAEPPKASNWGSPVVFDFSDEIKVDEDGYCERVLAVAVGLNYFKLYFHDFHSQSESVGQASVTLIPSIVDARVHVTANLVLTNYDGNDSSFEGSDDEGEDTCCGITVVALLGTNAFSDDNYQAIGNLYGVNNTVSGIPIPAASSAVFLSGFCIVGSSAQEISSLDVSASVAASEYQATIEASASLTAEAKVEGTADVMLLATDGITSYVVVEIDANSGNWSEVDEDNGVTLSFAVTVQHESNQAVRAAAVLLQKAHVEFERDKQSSIEMIEAGLVPGTLAVAGSQVTGTLRMNIFNERAGDDYGIAEPPESYLSAYVIAELVSTGDAP